MDDATVFSAQSMRKPVFAYRVMKLCEQGVLDLDAPLTRYTRDVFVKDDPRLKDIARGGCCRTPPGCRTGARPTIRCGSISPRA